MTSDYDLGIGPFYLAAFNIGRGGWENELVDTRHAAMHDPETVIFDLKRYRPR